MKYTAKQIHDLRMLAYKLRYARREGYLTNYDEPGDNERLSIESEVVTYMANGTTSDELRAELDTILADAKTAREAKAWAEGCVHCGHTYRDHKYQPPYKHGEWPPAPIEDIPCKGRHADDHACGCLSFHARGYAEVSL